MSGDMAAIRKLLEAHTHTKGPWIDLGCGEHKQDGFIGVDMKPFPSVDIVHDLETYPWPLPDECAELILASHLVEHIDPAHGGFLRFMDECWRILMPEGRMLISTPYAGSSGYWQDPTHINGCTERTWAYFDPEDPHSKGELWKGYKPKPWRVDQNVWSIQGSLEVALTKRDEAPYLEESS